MRPIVTLTTDFGVGSPYVAQMKGVMYSIARDIDLIDITHGIGPQNVREGAVVLADATPRFPPGTIHVAVVDPGVGTARRLVYCEIGTQRYLAPDNGLLSLLAQKASPSAMVSLAEPRYWLPDASHTFHGRDILAPVAAHLALGAKASQMGPSLGELQSIDWPAPEQQRELLTGSVLYVDSFGNIITNLGSDLVLKLGLPRNLMVQCGERQIRGIVPSYGAALPGEFVALFDSQSRLEIAQVSGHAAGHLHVQPGDMVTVANCGS